MGRPTHRLLVRVVGLLVVVSILSSYEYLYRTRGLVQSRSSLQASNSREHLEAHKGHKKGFTKDTVDSLLEQFDVARNKFLDQLAMDYGPENVPLLFQENTTTTANGTTTRSVTRSVFQASPLSWGRLTRKVARKILQALLSQTPQPFTWDGCTWQFRSRILHRHIGSGCPSPVPSRRIGLSGHKLWHGRGLQWYGHCQLYQGNFWNKCRCLVVELRNDDHGKRRTNQRDWCKTRVQRLVSHG